MFIFSVVLVLDFDASGFSLEEISFWETEPGGKSHFSDPLSLTDTFFLLEGGFSEEKLNLLLKVLEFKLSFNDLIDGQLSAETSVNESLLLSELNFLDLESKAKENDWKKESKLR